MKIIFYRNENHTESESRDNDEEVRLSIHDNDLIERRRYDFRTLILLAKSKKFKLSG